MKSSKEILAMNKCSVDRYCSFSKKKDSTFLPKLVVVKKAKKIAKISVLLKAGITSGSSNELNSNNLST